MRSDTGYLLITDASNYPIPLSPINHLHLSKRWPLIGNFDSAGSGVLSETKLASRAFPRDEGSVASKVSLGCSLDCP